MLTPIPWPEPICCQGLWMRNHVYLIEGVGHFLSYEKAILARRAVNAHEALVEACKAMIEEYEQGRVIQPFEIRQMCRHALALAEGKELDNEH